jgi:hypothetical protein
MNFHRYFPEVFEYESGEGLLTIGNVFHQRVRIDRP